MVPRLPPGWVTEKGHYEKYSKRPVSSGTPFVPVVTLIYRHISGNLKKVQEQLFPAYLFCFEKHEVSWWVNILQWWRQNFLTANNFNKMTCVQGCSYDKWVGRHTFQKYFSHSPPHSPHLFLSSFLLSKSTFLDILSSLHVNLRGWMWWEAVE